jgi:hypothetical protein
VHAITLVHSPPPTSLDAAVKALKRQQLHAPETCAPWGQPVFRLQLCAARTPALHLPGALAVPGGFTSLFFLCQRHGAARRWHTYTEMLFASDPLSCLGPKARGRGEMDAE